MQCLFMAVSLCQFKYHQKNQTEFSSILFLRMLGTCLPLLGLDLSVSPEQQAHFSHQNNVARS